MLKNEENIQRNLTTLNLKGKRSRKNKGKKNQKHSDSLYVHRQPVRNIKVDTLILCF